MIVYRVAHTVVKDLLNGSGNESRWCSKGKKVIYAASSIALATLENILRLGGSGFQNNYVTIHYEFPDDMMEEISVADLPAAWRLKSSYPDCQKIGDAWHDKKVSLCLKVPSALIPDEFNYVIKSTSPAIDKVKVLKITSFAPDERLEQLLHAVDVIKLKKS